MSKQRVLILCTGNSVRSQMAEGLLRHLDGDHFEVFSAGTKPAGLNLNAVKVMSEVGIDISGHRSKSVEEFTGQQFDYVITVCDSAREACPVFPGTGNGFTRVSKIRRRCRGNNNSRCSRRCAIRFECG